MKPLVIKGVPSLVNDLQALYEDEAKAKILGDLLHSMNDSMEEAMCLHPDDEEEQDPTVQFWLYYFLSQHYLRLADVDTSLAYCGKAIEHTPTVVDLYTHKAKIMQFAGNRQQAAALTEEARKLDLADRHLNAHSSRYLLKIDEVA